MSKDYLLMPAPLGILELARLRVICLFRGHRWRFIGDAWVGWRHLISWKCDRCDLFEIR